MERKLANFKKGVIPGINRARLARQWSLEADMEELDPAVLAIEAEAIAKQWEKMNVPTLGRLEEDRLSGTFRIMYCQLNSASTKESRTEKTHQIKQLADRYGAQGVAICEHCTNFSGKRSSQGLTSWFNSDRMVKGVGAWNTNGTVGNYLPGGTGFVGWFELAQVIKTTNVDWRGLGRWCSVVLWLSPTHKVRIVVAYSVGKSKPEGRSTVYQKR